MQSSPGITKRTTFEIPLFVQRLLPASPVSSSRPDAPSSVSRTQDSPALATSAPMSTESARPSFQTPAAELSKRPLQAGAAIPTGERGPAGVAGVAGTGGDAGDAPWPEQVPFIAGRGRPRADMGRHQQRVAILGNDSPAAAVAAAQVAKGMARRDQ